MTKLNKCITTQMNTANTFCSIQLHTSISMKSLKQEEWALRYSRHPEWRIWASSRSTSALPTAPLESASILLQPLKELAAMILTQTADRWLTSIPSKRPNSTTLKSTKCSVPKTILLKLNKAWEMSRIVLTSTLKTRTNNRDTVTKRIFTSKRRLEIPTSLAWNPPTCQAKCSKTSIKNTFVLLVNIKVHEHTNHQCYLNLYTFKYRLSSQATIDKLKANLILPIATIHL